MLAAVKRSVSIRVILTLPEIRPTSLTLMSEYDPTLLVIQPPQLLSSSTKKDTISCTSKQQQPATAKKKKVAQTKTKKKTVAKRCVIKKKNVKKKAKKKKDTTAVPKIKLHNADDETVATHENYSPKLTYSYKVQYKDGSCPTYTPFVLTDQF